MNDVRWSPTTINLGETDKNVNSHPELNGKGENSHHESQMLSNQRTRASHNPATEGILGYVPLVGTDGIDAALQRTREAQAVWAEWSPEQRAATLLQFRDALVADMEAICNLITMEQGKPHTETMSMELLPTLAHLKWLTTEGSQLLKGRQAPLVHPLFSAKQAHYQLEPLGIIAIISPWNYPFSIPVIQVLTALMAGNGVVLKPSPYVPLIGQKIAELFRRTNLPHGLLTVLQIDDADAPHLTSHTSVNKIIFTGSVATGRKVMASAAQVPTPVILELGGKDAAIVAADADLKRAVAGIVWFAMANTGQTCVSIEQVYVHRDIYDAFVAEAVQLVQSLRVGDGSYRSSQVGPFTNKQQLEIVQAQVEEAKAQGASVLVGGEAIAGAGYFYAPTILVDVTPEMRIMREETFGPVLPIIKVDSLNEAVIATNQSGYGLTASIWTRDKALGKRLAEQLHVGGVNINDHTFHFADPGAAWGGVKQSGFGRTHGESGLLEMVNLKFISIDMREGSLDAWWYPYNEQLEHFLQNAARFLYGPLNRRGWALISLLLNSRLWQRVNVARFAAAVRKWL